MMMNSLKKVLCLEPETEEEKRALDAATSIIKPVHESTMFHTIKQLFGCGQSEEEDYALDRAVEIKNKTKATITGRGTANVENLDQLVNDLKNDMANEK